MPFFQLTPVMPDSHEGAVPGPVVVKAKTQAQAEKRAAEEIPAAERFDVAPHDGDNATVLDGRRG